MFLKSTTIVASAIFAVLHHAKGSQQRQIPLIAAAVAAIILWKLYAGISATPKPHAANCSSEVPATTTRSASVRWTYDELAHKLIMENTDLAYTEVGGGFSRGIGKVMTKVAKQMGGKPVILNL